MAERARYRPAGQPSVGLGVVLLALAIVTRFEIVRLAPAAHGPHIEAPSPELWVVGRLEEPRVELARLPLPDGCPPFFFEPRPVGAGPVFSLPGRPEARGPSACGSFGRSGRDRVAAARAPPR